MTRTLALTNHKGAVGKSTSAMSIAFGLVNIFRMAGAAYPCSISNLNLLFLLYLLHTLRASVE